MAFGFEQESRYMQPNKWIPRRSRANNDAFLSHTDLSQKLKTRDASPREMHALAQLDRTSRLGRFPHGLDRGAAALGQAALARGLPRLHWFHASPDGRGNGRTS